MRYTCENNHIRLVNSTKILGTVITVHKDTVVIQKSAGGISFIPRNMISTFFYKEVR